VEVNVHGKEASEAIHTVVTLYNRLVAAGQRQKLVVIHGYGSSGRGGIVRTALRSLLDANGVDYLCGELVGDNPGRTILLPGEPITKFYRGRRRSRPHQQ
jgi:hypothetical protein